MPQDDYNCPTCPTNEIRHAVRPGVEMRIPLSAEAISGGDANVIAARADAIVLGHRFSNGMLQVMRGYVDATRRTGHVSAGAQKPSVESAMPAAAFEPAVPASELSGPQTVIVPSALARPTNSTLDGPYYLSGSMVTAGPLAGHALRELGMFQDEEKGEKKEEPYCIDEPSPGYIKFTPVKGVKSIRTLKKIGMPKKNEETGKIETEEQVVDPGKDKDGKEFPFPHWVYKPKDGATETEWKVTFKVCKCLLKEEDIWVTATQAQEVREPDENGYAGEPKDTKAEILPGYPKSLFKKRASVFEPSGVSSQGV